MRHYFISPRSARNLFLTHLALSLLLTYLNILTPTAHDERERSLNSERLLPRDTLVRPALRHGHIAYEVRRIRVRGRCAQVLPWGGRVPHYTQHLGQGSGAEVSILSLYLCIYLWI